MRKKFSLFILLAVSALVLHIPIAANAQSASVESVYDYADLLSSEEESELREFAADYEKYNISVIFLTTQDTEGKSSMQYSSDFYDNNPLFLDDGVLFMIDMDNREVYINTVGSCIGLLPDDTVYEILDEYYIHASNGEYFLCLEKISWDACTTIENQLNPVLGSFRTATACIPALILIAGITIFVLIRKHKKANRQISAEKYMGSNFVVNHKNVMYAGCRQEVLRGYYRRNENHHSGGSRGSSRSSGGGRSRSGGGGRSHGGGGRKF